MRPAFKKWITLLTGWAFLLLGVAGLFLPILQGILFIVIGLVILSSEYVWAHHLLEKGKQRFPWMAHHIQHAREYVHGLAHRRKVAAGPANPGSGEGRKREGEGEG